MLQFLANLKKILPLTKNSLLPALFLAVSMIVFYINENISSTSMLTLHWFFYIISFASLGTLIYFNQNKPSQLIVIIVLSYMAINYLKGTFGTEYESSSYYINISFLVPINLIFFCLIPQNKLFCKDNIYTLVGIFLQIAIVEKLSKQGINIGYNILSNTGINDMSLIIFIIGTIILLLIASMNGRIMQSYILFAFVEIMFGFIYSSNPMALTIFFITAIITIFAGLGYEIYYSTYKDVLTSLASRNSYIIQSKNFPMKYSIGIICIDEYNRLTRIFKKYELNALIMMIANKISELEKENTIYRYDKDEFIIVFKNENKKDTFEKIEEIRRAIAGAEFILSKRKKAIKLTISCCVSDKKRSDANSFDVLVRARKALEKTNKFSHNVSSKA